MTTGWRYRILATTGVAGLTASSVLLSNHPVLQHLCTTYVPLFNRLSVKVLVDGDLLNAILVSVAITLFSLLPMYKPRPRRVLDTVMLTQKRVLTAGLALAFLGYFEWSSRLPRATLVMTVGVMLVLIPAWFVVIRRPRTNHTNRAIIVGDDIPQMQRVHEVMAVEPVGYLAPSSLVLSPRVDALAADGGVTGLADIDHLGGLSRLEDIIVEKDIDTVVLAFGEPDRGEFFGALDACYEHGVNAKVHRDYTDSVLTPSSSAGALVDVEIEPWDWQDYVLKRLFDICFASVGLLLWAPFMMVIGIAIKFDSSGPIFYEQERTAVLGETFSVYKFRTMVPEGESAEPIDDANNDRVTDVGRFLRKTHLDEIPQLWSILTGEMSVVGPRAVWTDEEQLLEEQSEMWRKRWFVKPGLTGLAQINNISSTDPKGKLQMDLEYIRHQSFTYDLKIVIRQLWLVIGELL
ncbi:sugar transferase [Haloarchaeobius iranensis]|uniref:Sugar transferase involved in LPS biosynthesis (Colanic, teichoic acid) n=1 Tax=Haloarchaeobius iranensis TaxID=996166 RepID=A0A1H0C5R7_9EURY|nr:sugar transferase [Haloarchaeobius iranensis]SDN53234.1 Sugar transferase involved in LPS biosynthesis (colanic, teichoic acid) [Haloarchaeobius iranensis]